jgi:hypothetical protein
LIGLDSGGVRSPAEGIESKKFAKRLSMFLRAAFGFYGYKGLATLKKQEVGKMNQLVRTTLELEQYWLNRGLKCCIVDDGKVVVID